MKRINPNLRLPIALLLGSLVLGAGLFHLSLNTRLTCEARRIAEESGAEQSARAVREAPARLIQDQAEASLHSQIRNSGVLGPEDRVGWITALANTQTQLHLASVSWRMTPQIHSMLEPNLNVSSMEFTASPLDPDRLSALIAHLRATAPGRFTIEHCALTLDPNGINGQVNCRLNWWTLAQHAN